jgi:hypothetical protein
MLPGIRVARRADRNFRFGAILSLAKRAVMRMLCLCHRERQHRWRPEVRIPGSFRGLNAWERAQGMQSAAMSSVVAESTLRFRITACMRCRCEERKEG